MKKVLIIGGGSGIGFGIANKLKNSDYDVTCVGRKKRDNFELAYKQCDISKNENIANLFDNELFDVLIYCAGIISSKEESYNYNPDEIDNIIDINLKGCIKTNQLFIDNCLKNGINGKIINISSISNRGSKYFPIYATTKAGILTYTKSIASRYEFIKANVISPGVIKTDMSYIETPNFDDYIPDIVNNTPAKRLGTPEDIANVVAFLLSGESDFITGQEFIIDGGYSLPNE